MMHSVNQTPPTSLARQIMKRVVWMAIIGLLGLMAAIGLRIGESSRHLFDFRLHQHAMALIKHVHLDQHGNVTLTHSKQLIKRFRYNQEGGGKFRYVLLDDKGKILVGSEPEPALFTSFEPFPAGGVHYFQAFSEIADTIMVGVTQGFMLEGHHLYLQAAQNTQHMDAFIDLLLEEFFEDFGWAVIVAFALVLFAVQYTVRRGLAPLLVISRKAESLGPNHLDLRLPTDNLPLEILPLVTTVNAALDRLEEGFRRQGEFTADVAHELRTPLTVLMSRLELTLPAEQAAPLFADLQALIRLVNQLLKEAQLDTFVLPQDARADLLEICRDVVALLAPLAIREGKELAVEAEEQAVIVHGEVDALYQAVRNLVENAMRHTPRGEMVTVRVQAEPNVEIQVIDCGPGISAEVTPYLFKRFWRPKGGDRQGAGLGLAIVKKILDYHDATIAVTPAPERGSIFSIQFKKVV